MKYFIHLPMKMELTVSSETSAIRIQMPGNYPKRNKLHLEHSESFKNKNKYNCFKRLKKLQDGRYNDFVFKFYNEVPSNKSLL